MGSQRVNPGAAPDEARRGVAGGGSRSWHTSCLLSGAQSSFLPSFQAPRCLHLGPEGGGRTPPSPFPDLEPRLREPTDFSLWRWVYPCERTILNPSPQVNHDVRSEQCGSTWLDWTWALEHFAGGFTRGNPPKGLSPPFLGRFGWDRLHSTWRARSIILKVSSHV